MKLTKIVILGLDNSHIVAWAVVQTVRHAKRVAMEFWNDNLTPRIASIARAHKLLDNES